MTEEADLHETIRGTIQDYRSERGYAGGSGLTDRDQTNLVHRIADSVREKLEDIDDKYIRDLEDENERLENELRMAKGPGYDQLRNEYEGAKSLAKHLIYRLNDGAEDVVLTVDDLKEMEQRVDLMIEEEDGVIRVKVKEYEED